MREIVYYLVHLLAIVGVPVMLCGILKLQTDHYNKRRREMTDGIFKEEND
jgi:hypothetical protein